MQVEDTWCPVLLGKLRTDIRNILIECLQPYTNWPDRLENKLVEYIEREYIPKPKTSRPD